MQLQVTDHTSKSDSNEIDIELIPETSDTISDITNNKHKDTITDNVATSHPGTPTADNIYHFIEEHLLSLNPLTTMALGMLEYHETFHPHYIAPKKEGNFGKTLYRKSPFTEDVEANELGLVFF